MYFFPATIFLDMHILLFLDQNVYVKTKIKIWYIYISQCLHLLVISVLLLKKLHSPLLGKFAFIIKVDMILYTCQCSNRF